MVLEKLIVLAGELEQWCDAVISDDIKMIEDQQKLIGFMNDSAQRIKLLISTDLQEVHEGKLDHNRLMFYLVFDLRSPMNNLNAASAMILNPDAEWKFTDLGEKYMPQLQKINNKTSQFVNELQQLWAELRKASSPDQDNLA